MMKLPFTLLLAVTGLVCSAQDGNSASIANIEAKVHLIAPIKVTNPAGLAFGKIIVNPITGYGVITISPDGTAKLFGESNMWWKNNGGQAQAHPAAFQVSGEEGLHFIYWAQKTMNLKKDGHDTPLTLTTLFDSNPNAFVVGVGDGTIMSTFKVGGLLMVAPGTRPGTYSGSFEVFVQYL